MIRNLILILGIFFSAISYSQSDSLEEPMQKLPSLNFNRYSREIDSTIQDSLDIIYNFMIENQTAIIQVVGLFEHEKDFSPFMKRAVAVKKRLVEMGIPEARIKVIVEKYSEQNDPKINRSNGNVIFKILSFDYVPEKE